MTPNSVKISQKNSFLFNDGEVKEGEHRLEVTESNIQGDWEGCSPAAFVNCLKYQEDQELIDTGERGINELLQWTAICYRTSFTGSTKPSKVVDGSVIMYKGLGYNAGVLMLERNDNDPYAFMTQFANQINNNLPCNLSGAGNGIFTRHSTTGIGYSRQANLIQLIIHDGWNTTPNQPVYVKYLGYPEAELEYPQFMVEFHPGDEHDFDEADPAITAPKKANYKQKKKLWKWEENIFSRNQVKVKCYGYEKNLFDNLGHRYEHISVKRKTPYFSGKSKITLKKPLYKGGKAVYKYKLVDDNGHLFEVEYTTKLLGDISGTWRLEYTWEGFDTYEADWYIYSDGIFKDSYDEEGTWTTNNKKVCLTYNEYPRSRYSGKIKKKPSKMEGTMKDDDGLEGTWSAKLKSTDPKEEKERQPALKIKPDGSGKN